MLHLHSAVPAETFQRFPAKDVGIALITLRKRDDASSYEPVGVIAPVSLNSDASHFECNAHDPRGLLVKLLVAKKWCDWHDAYPLVVSFVPDDPGSSFYRAVGIERAFPSAMVATGATCVSVTWAGTSGPGLPQLAARTTKCSRAARARRRHLFVAAMVPSVGRKIATRGTLSVTNVTSLVFI